jgi:F-type H+-transporting ATPase subunit b
VELTWTTFVLEIINFVVLVWILKHFLYRPVLDVIAERRRAIEAKLNEAHRLNDEAQALKDQYGGRIAAWEAERRKALDSLNEELAGERARRLQELEAALAEAGEKARVAGLRKAAEEQRSTEIAALRQAAAFSSKLLGEASGPELERRLVALLLTELDALPAERIASLREQWGEPPSAIEVTTAFELGAEERGRLEKRLREITGLAVPVRFARDDGLIAGIQIAVGAWILAASVRDELAGFAELAVGTG